MSNASFTTTTTITVQPAVGSSVAVSVVSEAGFSPGEVVLMPGGGFYAVRSTAAGILNLENLGYPDNVAPLTLIPLGEDVGPAGSFSPERAVVPQLTHLRYVDKNYVGGSSNGSIARPYTTIMAAIADILTYPAQAKIWWGVLVAPDQYDEDIVFDGTDRQIAILGLGPWGLGTFTGVAGAPVAPFRNVIWSVSADSTDSTQHSFMIGQYQGPNMGLSTHIAIQSVTRISGNIQIRDNFGPGGTTKTVIVSAQVFDGATTGRSIDTTGGTSVAQGGTNLWIFASRFASAVYGVPSPGGIQLQWVENSRFDGLVNVRTYNRIQNCRLAAGMTITAIGADIQPRGFIATNFAGTFTGIAASLLLDGNTNYWFKTNGALLGGAATKVIQDDLVP